MFGLTVTSTQELRKRFNLFYSLIYTLGAGKIAIYPIKKQLLIITLDIKSVFFKNKFKMLFI